MINNDELKKKILDEIEKAGLPLEIKTSNILELDSWQVINQEGYLDSDDKSTWRTSDIRANKANSIDERTNSCYNYFTLSLIIECKKSAKPWVFFMKDIQGYPDLLLLKIESQPVFNRQEIFEWRGFHHYYSSQYTKKSIISYEPLLNIKKEGAHDIFKAANQVTKALNYHLERMLIANLASIKEAKEKGQWYYLPFVICYPVIVFDGQMFEYNGISKLVPTQYVQYLFSHKFPLLGDKFIIDIVHIDFLERYLRIINSEFALLNKRIESIKSNID